jgi:hypothetical protein
MEIIITNMPMIKSSPAQKRERERKSFGNRGIIANNFINKKVLL